MNSESISDRVRKLASGKCGPCKYTKPLTVGEARERLRDLPGWVLQSGSLQKEFRFKSYLDGLDFAYSLGKIAEMENHHPDLAPCEGRIVDPCPQGSEQERFHNGGEVGAGIL